MQAIQIHPGRVVIVGILIPLLLLLNSCAVFFNGLNQSIPVSTEPVGVEVYLDGEFMGVTPLELQVWRGQTHELLLRYGEQENLLQLEQSGVAGLVVDAIPAAATLTLFALGPCDPDYYCAYFANQLLLPVLGTTALVITIDMATGAIYTLNPGEVYAVFEVTQP